MSSSFARLGCDNNPLRLFWNSWTEAGASTPPSGSWVLPVCEHDTLSFVKKNLWFWKSFMRGGRAWFSHRGPMIWSEFPPLVCVRTTSKWKYGVGSAVTAATSSGQLNLLLKMRPKATLTSWSWIVISVTPLCSIKSHPPPYSGGTKVGLLQLRPHPWSRWGCSRETFRHFQN